MTDALEKKYVYFAPRTLCFWRNLVVIYCVCSFLGHWAEIPYCLFMDKVFGIVDDTYAVWSDPWYYPYWIYGVGAVVVTLAIEPVIVHALRRRRTLGGAMLQSFLISVLICMALELLIGVLVNSPNELGEYPYWDNSVLPFNILGQAWLVNDVVIALIAMIWLWGIYPVFCRRFAALGERAENGICVLCLLVLVAAYVAYYFNVFRIVGW